MNRVALLGILVLAANLAPAQQGGGGSRGAAEREIRALETEFAAAVVRADRAFYERVLAEDFTHTSHSGKFKTRAQWLGEDKFDKQNQRQTSYDSFEVVDLAVRLYGDTAVVTGKTIPRGRDSKGQAISGQYRFLRVWVKRDGRWQAVAFQGTRIADP